MKQIRGNRQEQLKQEHKVQTHNYNTRQVQGKTGNLTTKQGQEKW